MPVRMQVVAVSTRTPLRCDFFLVSFCLWQTLPEATCVAVSTRTPLRCDFFLLVSFCLWQTLPEKLGLMGSNAEYDSCAFVDAGVERLGISQYMYLVEVRAPAGVPTLVCAPQAHGGVVACCVSPTPAHSPQTNSAVASACLGPDLCATTFSSPAMLSASFNRSAWFAAGQVRIGSSLPTVRVLGLQPLFAFAGVVWLQVISTEMRALHNAGDVRFANVSQNAVYQIGLHGYGPNVRVSVPACVRACLPACVPLPPATSEGCEPHSRLRWHPLFFSTHLCCGSPPPPLCRAQINLMRDPRWGRNSEVPGEDPFLSGEYATYFVRGLQGGPDELRYLKMSAGGQRPEQGLCACV
jgi:hypothetical protein